MPDHDSPTAALAEEWCLVLQVDSASPAQDFFGLGGDSLLAMELAERFEQRTGSEFPIEALFEEGTFGAIVKAIES